MKFEIPDKVVTMAVLMDSFQSNRADAKTPEDFGANLEKSKELSQRIGDIVASIILKEVRKSQNLPMYVPRK